jgi:hypothetical protein
MAINPRTSLITLPTSKPQNKGINIPKMLPKILIQLELMKNPLSSKINMVPPLLMEEMFKTS